MIGKPEWFERRKYGGWGISPRTWQGYAYIAAFIIPFVAFQVLPFWDNMTRVIVTVAWLAVLLFDTLNIMAHLNKDEREQKIEALSERNAAWAMVAVLIAGLLYQLVNSAIQKEIRVDWFLALALAAGVAAKGLSNFFLERKAI